MNRAQQGFLLLTSHLGDDTCKPLTVAQFRTLLQRVQTHREPDLDRELTLQDLIALGYDRAFARNVLYLLSRNEQLAYYLNVGKKQGCIPLTRISADYPAVLRSRLGTDCPGCLWLRGDQTLLQKPAVALVGSRDLGEENQAFAREVGIQAAKQGYVLISGNARGADRTAQQACQETGGQVIAIVADRLTQCPCREDTLYISEDGYDQAFTPQRAHSRNRLIHSLGNPVLVAQSTYGKGGTWTGTKQNLYHGYNPVFCFQDGSAGVAALIQMGAEPATMEDLKDLSRLQREKISFL